MLNIDSYLLYSTKKKVYHKVQFMIIPIDGAHVSKGSFSFEMQNVKILLRHFKYILNILFKYVNFSLNGWNVDVLAKN